MRKHLWRLLCYSVLSSCVLVSVWWLQDHMEARTVLRPALSAVTPIADCAQYAQVFDAAFAMSLEDGTGQLVTDQWMVQQVPDMVAMHHAFLENFYVAAVAQNPALLCAVNFLRHKGDEIPVLAVSRVLAHLFVAQRGVDDLAGRGGRL